MRIPPSSSHRLTSLESYLLLIQLTPTQLAVFTLRPQESTYLSTDLFTNCWSRLIKLSHTLASLLPSFATDQAFCPGLLLTLSSFTPFIFCCHPATWLSIGCRHRRHSWQRLRSKAFIQTAGLLWPLHKSTPRMHYLSEQVS